MDVLLVLEGLAFRQGRDVVHASSVRDSLVVLLAVPIQERVRINEWRDVASATHCIQRFYFHVRFYELVLSWRISLHLKDELMPAICSRDTERSATN